MFDLLYLSLCPNSIRVTSDSFLIRTWYFGCDLFVPVNVSSIRIVSLQISVVITCYQPYTMSFCHRVYLSSWFVQHTHLIFTQHWQVFVMDRQSVLCELQNELLIVVQKISRLWNIRVRKCPSIPEKANIFYFPQISR